MPVLLPSSPPAPGSGAFDLSPLVINIISGRNSRSTSKWGGKKWLLSRRGLTTKAAHPRCWWTPSREANRLRAHLGTRALLCPVSAVCHYGPGTAGVLSAHVYLCCTCPASQGHRLPSARSCLPSTSASSRHPRPCPPLTQIRCRHSASWKVAITNPIYDSQRDKTKRWRSPNKWKNVLSFNFSHQQDHLSFKIATFNRMGWVGGRESHLSFEV